MPDLDIPDIARKSAVRALDDLICDGPGLYELIDSHGDQDATAALDEGQWDSAAEKLREALDAIRDRLDAGTALTAVVLRDMADSIDRGPAIPLPPSVYSALIRERADDIIAGSAPEEEALVLIWSNQHGQWWRPGGRGYTAHIHEAGRYPLDAARRIVADSTCEGRLLIDRTDPVTGETYEELDEVIVPAPEVTP